MGQGTLIRFALTIAITMVAFASHGAEPLPHAKAEEVGMSSKRLERIGLALGAEIEAGNMPGAVVAIARRGKLVYYEAFGFLDREAGTPMTKEAIFAPASMEKPLIAVAALQLVEAGRLVLGDAVEKYLPQLADMQVAVWGKDASGKAVMRTEPQKRKMTILDLLRHTAGLTYGRRGDTELHKLYPISSNWSAENLTASQFLQRIGKLPLHYQPGTKWDYSLSFDVMGLVIEAISRQPLDQYMQDNLFGPLGMVDTAFVIPPEKADRYAMPLPRDPITGRDQRIRDVRKRPKFACGGGCAAYTAADYLRFAQMLLDHGKLGNVRILSRKSIEYMTSDQLGPEVDIRELRDYPNINGYGFGLGVAVRRGFGVSTFLGSPGDFHWAGANGTHFWVDPREELAVVYMAHTPGEARFRYRQLINALVLQAIDD